MNFELGKVLKVPRGTPGLEPLQLELGEVAMLEVRKQELSFVTKATAQSLMSSFIRGCEILHKHIVQINYEYTQAVKYVKMREAIVMLDLANDILKQKGVGNSADLRKAVVTLDAEYQKYVEVQDFLKATYEYLRGKHKSFEMAYQSAKKVYYNDDRFEDDQHLLRESLDESSSDTEIIGNPGY